MIYIIFWPEDKAETPVVLWPPHAKSLLIEKDPEAGRDWGQAEKGMTEDEMAGCREPIGRHSVNQWIAKEVPNCAF